MARSFLPVVPRWSIAVKLLKCSNLLHTKHHCIVIAREADKPQSDSSFITLITGFPPFHELYGLVNRIILILIQCQSSRPTIPIRFNRHLRQNFFFTNEPLTTRAKIFHLLGHLDPAQSASRFSSINFWRDEYTLLKWLVVVIWTSCNNSLQVLASKHYPASPLLRAST